MSEPQNASNAQTASGSAGIALNIAVPNDRCKATFPHTSSSTAISLSNNSTSSPYFPSSHPGSDSKESDHKYAIQGLPEEHNSNGSKMSLWSSSKPYVLPEQLRMLPVSSQQPTISSNSPSCQPEAQRHAHDRDKKYTRKQQLVMFREAFKLPMDGAGPFIPQQMYKSHMTSDRRRYVEEVLLDHPLYFYSDGPTQCGILLKDALHSRTKKLANRDQVVFEGRGPSVSIRLEWPGYRQWSRQIPTKDFRNPPGPITLAKLAKNVAKCVQRFIQERKGTPMEDDADQHWQIGDGPNDIKLEDLVLVSMHHISLGSWQPQLRLVRPREPRFSPSIAT